MNEQQITESVESTIAPARKFLVIDNKTLLNANDILKAIKGRQKAVKEFFGPLVEAAHKTHKALTSKRKEVETPLVNAETYLKRQVGTYIQEQQRKEREEQERLRQIEIKKQEEAQLLAAKQAEDAGDNELAETIVEEEVYVPPPVVESSVPKLKNISMREAWKCEVVDLMALCKAVAAGTVPIQAIQANTVFLGQQVRSLQTSFRVPGVRGWDEQTPSVR